MTQDTITKETTRSATAGIELRAEMKPGYETILTPAALAFVAGLERRFGARYIVSRQQGIGKLMDKN